MSALLVVAGLSGAGRSTAGAALEDAGWFVVDNLPLSLIPKVLELAAQGSIDRLALVVGRPFGDDYEALVESLAELRVGQPKMTLVFLDASDDVLVSRYEGTKRRHPIPAEGIVAAIKVERSSMAAIKGSADIVIETSEMSVHELKARILALVDDDSPAQRLKVLVTSFGFKFGVPIDADMVIDTRFLPNPYWHSDLRERVGLDLPVREFVLSQPDTQPFLDRLFQLLEFLLPRFVEEGKSYLNIGIGCTGGRHRSVVIAEVVASYIQGSGFRAQTQHRDLAR